VIALLLNTFNLHQLVLGGSGKKKSGGKGIGSFILYVLNSALILPLLTTTEST